jgi:hypothetical protein
MPPHGSWQTRAIPVLTGWIIGGRMQGYGTPGSLWDDFRPPEQRPAYRSGATARRLQTSHEASVSFRLLFPDQPGLRRGCRRSRRPWRCAQAFSSRRLPKRHPSPRAPRRFASARLSPEARARFRKQLLQRLEQFQGVRGYTDPASLSREIQKLCPTIPELPTENPFEKPIRLFPAK